MILLVERRLTKFMGMVTRRNEGRKGPPQWNNTSWWVTCEGLRNGMRNLRFVSTAA
ncbi:MAG: hypothetical protein ACTS45_01605 [Candidatus Hodgkinia cicadicola]